MYSPRELQQILLNGSPAERLLATDNDPGILRPWKGKNGKTNVTLRTGKMIRNAKGKRTWETQNFVVNAPALLRREDWLEIDREINWQAKQDMRFWKDMLSSVGRPIPGGMGVQVVNYTVADREADVVVSMSPLRRSERTRPQLDFRGTPLPILSSDGSFDIRELATSRRGGMGLDTTMMTDGARKIGETLEKMALGLTPTFTYAQSTIYGATTIPGRIAVTFTSPEAGGWVPSVLVNELIWAIYLLETNFFNGPYKLYFSNRWGVFFDRDYAATYGGETLATRMEKLRKITSVQNLDYLPDYTLLLVQMTPNVCRALNLMDLQTVQWEQSGGMELMYKLFCAQAPEFRTNFAGNTGIVHGTSTAPSTTTSTTTTTTTTT